MHVEAPDECGHQGNPGEKTSSIEKIDELILGPVFDYLKDSGDNFRIMVLPDHPTPLELRTHSKEPVPFFIYDSEKSFSGPSAFTEKKASEFPLYIEDGSNLMGILTSEDITEKTLE